MLERVSVPGFLRRRRYAAYVGSHRYFTLYETETVETLVGGPYLERLHHPTPCTRWALPLFRNNKHAACRVTASLGQDVAALGWAG